MNNLERFLNAQKTNYAQALSEIRNGGKRSHWMWYIFPQIAGLGFSSTSKFYAIKDKAEAVEYLRHPVLGGRLIEISEALLAVEGATAHRIFGSPDDVKLKSSMTLFAAMDGANPVFQKVLDRYFDGERDGKTLQLIEE